MTGTEARLSPDERAVLSSARPGVARGAAGIITGVLAAVCTVALLATSAYLITRAAEQPPVLFLSLAVVGVRAFALGRAFFRYLERLTSHDAVFRQLEEVRGGLIERLIPLAPTVRGGVRRGSALEAMASDVDELQNLPLRVIQPLVTSLGVAVVAVVGVALLSPVAAAGLAACLVLSFVVAASAVHRLSASAERTLAPKRTALSNAVLDYLGSLDVLTAYGAEPEYRERIRAADEVLTSALRRRALGAGLAAAALGVGSGMAVAIAMVAGVNALEGGALSGPGLAVVVLIPLAVFEVVALVPLALSAWREVRSSAGRLAELAPSTVPARVPRAQPGQHENLDADMDAPPIDLRHVSVSWSDESGPVLRDVSLRIERGERVLIEGASGSGKTTLAQALVRFVEVEGEYRLFGRDVTRLTPDAVRGVVGLCEQTPYLFDESIRQNLLFAREDATDEELLGVLERVGLLDWLTERGGLDARVGERGAMVSGGQAQRIALARVLLHDFEVIVFDEPTANVELDLAGRLVAELMSAAGGRTVILITHGDVPDHLVDRRVRMSGGRIVG